MSQTTLSKLENVLICNGVDTEKVVAFCDMFKHYKTGQWIYPGIFKRKKKISIEKVYIIFNELENMGILASYFEVNCGQCKKTLGEVYKTLVEVPDQIYCENCHEYVEAKANTYLIYKVL